MKVLVCGGRDYKDYGFIAQTLSSYTIDTLINGAAEGADRLANIWANVNHVPCTTYPANWELHGKKAGPLRNQQMLDDGKPDLVIAFPGGKGTAHMVKIAKAANVPVVEPIKEKNDESNTRTNELSA